MQIPEIKRGQYLLITTDGAETLVQKKPHMNEICAAISSSGIDTVTLKRSPRIIMMVDDTGMIDGKRVNSKATTLYHSVCKPGTGLGYSWGCGYCS